LTFEGAEKTIMVRFEEVTALIGTLEFKIAYFRAIRQGLPSQKRATLAIPHVFYFL